MKSPRLKLSLPLAALLTAVFSSAASGRAQTAPVVPAPKEDVVELSRFEVRASADNSYNVNEATAGLKTRTPLIDVAGSVQIVPRILLEDLPPMAYPSDYAKFASSGVASFGVNNLFYMRGERQTTTFKNGVLYFPAVDDDVTTETMEVVKGAQSVLFGTRPVTQGMLLRTTKVPLYSRKNTLRATVDNNGFLRGEGDFTGPVGELGGAKVAYRLTAAEQKGKYYQDNNYDNRSVWAPSLNFDWRNTTLRVRYEFQRDVTSGIWQNGFFDQSQHLAKIGGWKQSYNAPWSNSKLTSHELETTALTRITKDFEGKLQVAYYQQRRYDKDTRSNDNAARVFGANGVLDPSDTRQFVYLSLFQIQKLYSVVNDYISVFNVHDQEQQTNFGWTVSSLYNDQALVTTPLISPATGTTQFSVVNPVWPVEPPDAFIPGSADTIQRNSAANAYVQHQAHLFGDKLIATFGGSWSWAQTTARFNVPGAAYLESGGDKFLKKFGLVYKPTKDTSVFVSQAENFTPPGTDDHDQAGNPTPPAQGKVKEAGVKGGFLENKISGSVVWFQNTTTGLPVRFNVGTPQVYAIAAGVVKSEGLEYDLRLNPVAGLNIIGTAFVGKGVKDDKGAYLPRTYKNTWSLLARYEFGSGPLKGLAVTANVFHMGMVYIRPDPAYPAFDVYNASFAYTLNKQWHFNLGINNLRNSYYAQGANGRFAVNASVPRTYALTTKYSF